MLQTWSETFVDIKKANIFKSIFHFQIQFPANVKAREQQRQPREMSTDIKVEVECRSELHYPEMCNT